MARLDVGRNAKDAEETRSRCPQTRTREVPGIPKNLEKGRGGPRRAPFCFTAREFSVRCSSLRPNLGNARILRVKRTLSTDGRTDGRIFETRAGFLDFYVPVLINFRVCRFAFPAREIFGGAISLGLGLFGIIRLDHQVHQ